MKNSTVKSKEGPEKPNDVVVININSIVISEGGPEKPNDVVMNMGTDFFDKLKVCRICLESSEKSSKIKNLGCDCKGSIGAAHHNCAVRWFSHKGNRVCEVCRKLAKNISIKNTADDEALWGVAIFMVGFLIVVFIRHFPLVFNN